MKRSTPYMAAAAVLTFAYCCGTANAVTIPISGNFSGVGSGSPSSETFTGTGHDTTFGDFNATETAALDSTSFPIISLTGGTFEFDFSGGGFFKGTFSGSGNVSSLLISFVINDGLLPGDTGQATGSGSFDPTTNTVSGNYSGFISGPGPDLGLVDGLAVTPAATPLPATLPMFLGGAGLIGLLARRRKQKAVAV